MLPMGLSVVSATVEKELLNTAETWLRISPALRLQERGEMSGRVSQACVLVLKANIPGLAEII